MELLVAHASRSLGFGHAANTRNTMPRVPLRVDRLAVQDPIQYMMDVDEKEACHICGFHAGGIWSESVSSVDWLHSSHA
jgi:hypothetical protein